MGASAYSSDAFTSRVASHKAAGTSAFTHDDDVKKGKVAAAVHATLDPKKVAGPTSPVAGRVARESRDSVDHPVSNAVVVAFDVTGSMGTVPRGFVQPDKFGALMSLLLKKGYILDPQILFAAIGDATTDQFPVQIGQFESGNEMDDALTNIIIEGNGGGQNPPKESYELMMYYMWKYTYMDCLEKRGKKGYMFLIGDERPYPVVKRGEVEKYFGEKIEADIPVEQMLEMLREKFEVFWIMPGGTANYKSPIIVDYLEKLFGQYLLKVDDPTTVSEVIAATIGVNEGYDVHSVSRDLVAAGASVKGATAATTALATYAAATALSKKIGTKDGDLPAGTDSVGRL